MSDKDELEFKDYVAFVIALLQTTLLPFLLLILVLFLMVLLINLIP
ncbi:MAG: hypothetical protein ACE5HW_01985 [Candidatus Methanofastidiosia archaeon]